VHHLLYNCLKWSAAFAATTTWAGAAKLDQDGDGLSDLWQQIYPGLVAADDNDGDGFSNGIEATAGTNPVDASSFPKLHAVNTPFGIELGWLGVAGKRYTLEEWIADDAQWIEAGHVIAMVDGNTSHTIDQLQPSGIFRLKIRDVDQDGDGLCAWEEHLLGFSDDSMQSSGEPARLDYSAALRQLEGTGELTLTNGTIIQKRPATHAEAARFLAQASFGANPAAIEATAIQGLGPWLDSNFSAHATSTHSMMFANSQSWDAYLWRKGWWRTIMLGEDQLRQRTAFALSQIFVVNCDVGSVIGDNAIIQARYYDLLSTGAFGNYRDLLKHITYSPVMGHYLSHLKNRKGDPSVNRFPDENFAREIMQLFTIGLWELNLDGSRKLNEQGELIPTYDNEVITGMAKVFTGFSFGGSNITSFFQGGGGADYYVPLKVWDAEHESGPKTIIGNITLPAGQTGDQDVAATLDALCSHQNIAPFIARLLIQRFTSSNPSPAYIRRVATAWSANENGGDLKATIEAILLDPEARTPAAMGDASGKVREPLLRLTALLRAFQARNATNTFPVTSTFNTVVQPLGQFPMLAPSVFNFYSPDHRPAGELRTRDLVAPELEISTTSRLLLTDNLLRQAIDFHFFSLAPDFSTATTLASDTDALINHLDNLLTWGQMSANTRNIIKHAVNAQTSAVAKVRTAVHLIAESPDFVVLK
jgi:uncharacterized protein (DUF1800 family)